MSTGVNRFFIGGLGCEDFGAMRRVMRAVRFNQRWRERVEDGEQLRPLRTLLKGREFAAYFMIVQSEQNPLIFLVGIPVAIGLYLVMFLTWLF